MKMKAQVKTKIGRFQPIKVEYELVEYETARVRNDRNLAKVRHSQRINDSLISCWVITEREGTIVSAHCLGCKAGNIQTLQFARQLQMLLFFLFALISFKAKV